MTKFTVKSSELAQHGFARMDAPYWMPEYREQERRLEECGLPLSRMSCFIESIESGEGVYELSDSDGWKYLNVNNITPNGIDDSNCGYLPSLTKETAANVIRQGDIVTGRVGTIGVFVKYECEEPSYISDNVFRLRLKDCNPDYILAVLNTRIVRNQIDREAKGSLQRVVNKQTIRNLLIPVPPPEVQRRMVAELDAAHAAKRKADEKATKLLASIDDMVLKELGIARLPKLDTSLSSRIFTVPARETLNGRLDSYSYSPFFADNLKRIRTNGSRRLGELVTLSHRQWDQKEWKGNASGDFPYIEIGAISVDDGEIGVVERVPIADAPSRAKMMVVAGDLLVSLTRPTRRAIAFATAEAIASTGFAVIHGFSDEVMPEYLSVILRSELCTYQFDQRSTGGNYPAITEEQLLRCEIPIPLRSVQDRIASMVSSIRTEARKLKANATAALDAAKRKIEMQVMK